MEKLKKIKKHKINKNKEENINLVSTELKEQKEKNKKLKEQNDQLLKDIITIKSNIRSLIPCLPENKLYPFPSLEDLISEIQTFINYDTNKLYIRLKKDNQFTIEKIVLHFKCILQHCQKVVVNHFSVLEKVLDDKFKNQDLVKPLKNILNNSYQVNWKNISNNLINEIIIASTLEDLNQKLFDNINQYKNQNLNFGYSSHLITHLKEYIKTTIEIFLKCYISQPQITIDLNKIGCLEHYNPLLNEILLNELMIKGEEGYIVIPNFIYKNSLTKRNHIINKIKMAKNTQTFKIGDWGFSTTTHKKNNFLSNQGTKSSNYFFNRNKYANLSTKYSIVNLREKKSDGYKMYDRKKNSDIKLNSKSNLNRNVNYYKYNFNNHSITFSYDTNKVNYKNNKIKLNDFYDKDNKYKKIFFDEEK